MEGFRRLRVIAAHISAFVTATPVHTPPAPLQKLEDVSYNVNLSSSYGKPPPDQRRDDVRIAAPILPHQAFGVHLPQAEERDASGSPDNAPPPSLIVISQEVQSALAAGRPVVALESTIISHGMPYPQARRRGALIDPGA